MDNNVITNPAAEGSGLDSAAPMPVAEEPQSVISSVKRWTQRIRDAKNHWDNDFKRMRKNMEFVAGYQWEGQENMDDLRYVANVTLRLVNDRVASLYARNPRVVPEMRKRMDFQVWDGKMESLQQAAAMMQHPEADPAHSMAAVALISDYTNGMQMRHVIGKVGETLEKVFAWQLDNQAPSFKGQMKHLVRQTVVTGVGYVRLDFARGDENPLSTVASDATKGDRVKQAQLIMRKLQDGEITEDSPEIETLKTLVQSFNAYEDEQTEIPERLVFDFPPSTTVILDPRCRCLKGFVGARWIAQEYLLPLNEVNAHFGTKVSVGAGDNAVQFTPLGNQIAEGNVDYAKDGGVSDVRVCVWNVFDLDTKSSFFICDGWKEFLEEPAPVYPETKHFWPIFALTFNDVIVEDGQKATPFPPSDVQLVTSPQKELNRSRQALREQRKANAPKYMTGKGWLTDEDKESLVNSLANSVIELQGAAPNDDINKKLSPFQHASIDPLAYDTAPINEDLFHVFGNEDSSQPASSKSTATAATINEQARVTTTSSNVDDLDDFLSAIAEAGGEILIRECSSETVRRIAGPGAVWPEQGKEDFIDMIFLKIVAASSGRPNKALELANFQQIAPILLQAGANPMFIVREAIKRLDDKLDIEEAFALGPIQPMAPTASPVANGPKGGRGVQAQTPQGQMPGGTVPSMQRPKLNDRPN